MPAIPGFAPTLPGVSKTDAPATGKDMMGDMLAKLAGGSPGPRSSAGDDIAQALQLLRQAAQKDPRIAPLVNSAIQSLVTGSQAGGPQPAMAVDGPNSQLSGAGNPSAMSAIASMMKPPGA